MKGVSSDLLKIFDEREASDADEAVRDREAGVQVMHFAKLGSERADLVHAPGALHHVLPFEWVIGELLICRNTSLVHASRHIKRPMHGLAIVCLPGLGCIPGALRAGSQSMCKVVCFACLSRSHARALGIHICAHHRSSLLWHTGDSSAMTLKSRLPYAWWKGYPRAEMDEIAELRNGKAPDLPIAGGSTLLLGFVAVLVAKQDAAHSFSCMT